jgi:hypothetical protein
MSVSPKVTLRFVCLCDEGRNGTPGNAGDRANRGTNQDAESGVDSHVVISMLAAFLVTFVLFSILTTKSLLWYRDWSRRF